MFIDMSPTLLEMYAIVSNVLLDSTFNLICHVTMMDQRDRQKYKIVGKK